MVNGEGFGENDPAMSEMRRRGSPVVPAANGTGTGGRAPRFDEAPGRMAIALAVALALAVGGCVSGPVGDPAGPHLGDPAEPFFEGWFTRVSDGASGDDLVIIQGWLRPGGASGEPGEAFLLVHGGSPDRVIVRTMPAESATAATEGLEVEVGTSRLTSDRISGSVDDGTHRCRWDLTLENPRDWPAGYRRSPSGIGLELALENWWHVIHLSAEVSGTIRWNDEPPRVLKGGSAYLDKNWGEAFPERWIWLQANRFEGEGEAAFAMAGGRARMAGGGPSTDAFVIGFHDGETFRRFASHLGDRIDFRGRPGEWWIEAVSGGEKLRVTGRCSPESLVPLPVPTRRGMGGGALQSMEGQLRIELFRARVRPRPEPARRIAWESVATWRCSRAALEVGGEWAGGNAVFSGGNGNLLPR